MDTLELESNTQKMVARMLRESTGMSNGANGDNEERFWEQNENRDFEHEPNSKLSFKDGLIKVTHSAYHFMVNYLEYDRTLNNLFYRKFKRDVDPDDDMAYLKLMEKFPKWMSLRRKIQVHGLCGEGEPVTVNTYNESSLLDQGIQFVYFEIEEKCLALVQVHNGSDIRGGYTEPKTFEVKEGGLFNYGVATIKCLSNPEHFWATDSHHWWYQGKSAGSEPLDKLERKMMSSRSEHEAGKLCIVESADQGFCPHCAGKLKADF